MLSSTHVVSAKRNSSARKRNLKVLAASIAAIPLFGLGVRSAAGAVFYFDTNGTTPGTGVGPSSNAWDNVATPFWSSDSTGGSATGTWTPGSDAVFSAGTNATGIYTVTPAADIQVGNVTVEEGTVSTTSKTVTVSGAVSISSGAALKINLRTVIIGAASGKSFTLNGGTLENTAPSTSSGSGSLDTTFNLKVSGTGGTVNFSTAQGASGFFVYTAAAISGTGGLTFEGTNEVFRMTTHPTYTGPTTIAGTGGAGKFFELRTNTVSPIPTGTDLTVSGSISGPTGVLNLGGTAGATNADSSVNSLSGGGIVALAGKTLTISGAIASNFGGVFQDQFVTLGGVAESAGTLLKNGAGTLTLSGLNTQTGTVNLNVGAITVSAAGQLSGVADVTQSASTTLTMNQAAQTIRNLSGTGSVVLNGTILTSQATLDANYAGVISGTNGGFTYNGSGHTGTLSGINTYTGATTVSGGTLTFTHPIPSSSTVVAAGGTLALGGVSSTVPGVTLQGGTISGAGTLTSTSAFDVRSGTASSILGGGVGMNKTTAGTATLTAANTYTGDTTISAGKLLVNNTSGSGTGGGSNIFVNNTGTLGGTGSMSGAVNVNTGGHIAPGTGIASNSSLTAPSVDFKNGSALDFTLGTAADPFGVSDTLNVTAASGLNLEASTGNPTLVNIFASASGTYHLINYNTSYLGLIGPGGNLQLGTLSGAETANLIDNTANHSIDVQVTLADRIWNVNSGGDWKDGTNWLGGPSPSQPNGVGVVAEFTSAINSPVEIDLSDSDKTVGALKFDNTCGANFSAPSYTILAFTGQKIIMSTGGPNATITDLNGTQDIEAGVQLNNTTDVMVSHSGDVLTILDVSGANGMNKKGAGTLVISNSYTASGALNNTDVGDLTVSGMISGTGGVMNSGPGTLVISGSMSGAGSVTATAGTIKLPGSNSYTGKTFFNGGQIIPASDGSLGAVPGSPVADNLTFNGGTLVVPSGGLSISTNRGMTVQTGGGTVSIPNAGDSLAYTGVINNSSGGRFTIQGPGKYTLTTPMVGSLTSSVGITNGGTIQFASAGAFNTQQKIVLDGGTLAFTGTGNGTAMLTGINLEIGASGTGTVSDLDDSGHVIAQSAAFTGAVTGTGTLIKAGDGEFRMTSPGGNSNTKLEVDGGFYRVSGSPTVALADTQLGAVPGTFLADAVDLNGTGPTRSTGGVAIGTSANITTPVTRGIKIETNGATFGTNANWTINSVISGPGGLSLNENGWAPTFSTGNKAANFSLSLAGNNTYGGPTNINNGILEANGGQAIPDGSAVTILSATSVAPSTSNGLNDQAVFRIINGDEKIGSLAGGGGTPVAGNPAYGFVSLGTGGSLTTGFDDTSTTFSGQITGTGNVTKVGAGTWTIKGFDLANTGATNINAGVLQYGLSPSGLNNASTVTIAAAGTLDMNSFVDTIGALAGAGPIINGANLTIAGSNASPVTYSGNYSGGGTLTKSGAGTEVLTGSNAFGTVTISGGVLAVNSSNALGTSGTNALVFGTGGTLRTDADLSTGRSVTLNTGGGIIDSNGNNDVLSTVIAGAGSITKQGTGTLALTNNNTYSGVTNINGGTLIVTSSTNLGDNSGTNNIAFNGGILRTDNADFVTTRSIALNAGGGTVNSNGNNVTLSGIVSGAGSLTKTGVGVLQATNTNTYSGVTNVFGGEVRATTSDNLGNASATNGIGLDTGGQLTLLGPVVSPLRNIAVSAGGGTIDAAMGNDSTFGNVGPGTGSGTITKANTGTVTVNYVRTAGVAVTGGTLKTAASTSTGGTSVVSSVNVAGGMLDLNDNKLVVVGGSVGAWNATNLNAYDGITHLVQLGRHNGAWDQNGIITSQSAAKAINGQLTTLAVASAADVKDFSASATALFGGQTVHASDVLVMYTYMGDANLDGKVNADDYFQIDSNYNKTSDAAKSYRNGDFNYDGLINGDDYAAIDASFAGQTPGMFSPAPGLGGLAGVSAVPEPASLAVLALGVSTLGIRRRRR